MADASYVELKDTSVDKDALAEKIKAAVRQSCRLKVDAVEFVEVGAIDASARAVVDERSWE